MRYDIELKEPQGKEATEPSPAGRRTVLHALLVEDSAADAGLILHELREAFPLLEHARVETAGEFVAALDRQAWDIVLCDYNLPTFGVLPALALLRQRSAYLPFIIVSGFIGEEMAVEAMRLGADDYVMKGNLARLVPAVKRELAANELRRKRVQAERSLRDSEARFRGLIEQAADGIFVIDDKGRFMLVNPRFCEMTGYRDAELLRLHAADLFPDSCGNAFLTDHGLFHSAGGRRFEHQTRRKDGSVFPVEISMRRIDKGWGQCIARDITERRKAERELMFERQLLQNLMDRIPDTIYFKDRDLRYVRVNKALAATLGLRSPEEAIGRRASEIIGAEALLPSERREMEIVKRGLPVADIEEQHVLADGSKIWYLRTEAPIKNERGEVTGLVAVSKNVTAHKDAEQKLLRLNRVYALLGAINALIVRVRNREELFREACQLAVVDGRFLLAYIAEFSGQNQLHLAATSNADREFVQRLGAALKGDVPEVATAIERLHAGRKTVVRNDLRDVPPAISALPTSVGAGATITLPLVVSDRVFGVFGLYCNTPGFFDAKETKLLEELAGDIAFAIDNLDKAEKLDHLAFYDQLTGLANSTLFRDRLAQHLRSVQHDGGMVGLALFDVQGFKNINDALGRAAGDALLKELALRMARCPADSADVARIEADHFALMLPHLGNESDAARHIRGCMDVCFRPPFMLAGNEVRVSGRVGVALFPNDGGDVETLFRNAEAALKKAKRGDGLSFLFYTREMNARIVERLALENKLRRALEREEFVLQYQPKVEFGSGRITGVEALLRWNDPETGLVAPGEFVPVLEETGLILDVGTWALRRAVRDHAYWLAHGLAAPRIAVNVSPVQLRQSNFVDVVREAIAGGSVPPGIDLEITESLIMENIEANVVRLKALRDLGINVAIDDFGTGYSSLAYLARLPVKTVKIDRSFIITMLQDPNTMTLVSTIISLAHSLGLEVVAEGVDEEDQAKVLRLLRCGEMQGYLFGKSVSRDEIAELIAT